MTDQSATGGSPACTSSAKPHPATRSKKPDLPNFPRPSVWGSIARIFVYHIPLYMIVGCLVLIALPRPIQGRISDVIQSVGMGTAAAKPAPQQSPEGAGINPVARAASAELAKGVGDSSIGEVARLALQDSKEKYDSIKDTYDKLFSLIAAIAALIAFLGFKGVDSFVTARNKADEILARATDAQTKADAACARLQTFLEVEYPRNNRAELNVTTGVVLRHIADVYKDILKIVEKDADPLSKHEYQEALSESLRYLKMATKTPDGVESTVLVRGISTMSNVYRRLGKLEAAVEVLEDAIRDCDDDETLYYNLACYACMLAKEAANGGKPADASRWEAKAIMALRRSIDLDNDGALIADSDPDFDWFRHNQKQEFVALVKSLSAPKTVVLPASQSSTV